MVDPGLIAEILSVVLALLAAFLGVKFGKAVQKIHAIRVLLDDLDSALADRKITKAELQKIAEDLRRVVEDP